MKEINLESLAPMPPPYPPLPRLLFQGSSLELLKVPTEVEEIEDVMSSIFQTVRGVHSAMQFRRQFDRLLRVPTRIFPFGKRSD